MGVSIELTGMSDLIEALERQATKVEKAKEKILQRAAEPVLADMQSTKVFNDRTGTLRGSLKIGKIKIAKGNNGRHYVQVGDVDSDAGYAWYVEYGHSKTPARPFIQPALERNEREVLARIREGLEEALR